MKIKVKDSGDFLHDTKRYRAGRSYDVDDGLGTYFVMSGWATSDAVSVPGQEPPGEVDLDVQDSTLGHTSEVRSNG